MRNIYLMVAMVIFMIGCGSSKVPNNTLKETFPKNIILSIPLKLEANRKMLTVQSIKSYSYETMQLKLLEYRNKSSELQFNMELIRKVIPKIELFCTNIGTTKPCIIPANTFSLKLTNPELRALKKRYGALDIIFDNNDSLPIGEIIMINEYEGNLYNYQLKVDISVIYQTTIGEVYERFYAKKILKKRQCFSWSKDNNTYVSLEEESNISKDYFNMEFIKTKEMKELTHIYRVSQYSESNYADTLTWIKNNDQNNSYSFQYNDHSNTVYAEVSDNIGFFFQSSFNDNRQIAVFFNNEGYEIGQYGCGGYDECLLSDKSTWSTEYESELNASVLDEKFQLFARNIVDENSSLEDGEYFLISSEMVLSENLNEEILQKNIGTFLINNKQGQGIVYSQDFIDSLDNIKIYKALSPIYDKSRYKEIDREEYPSFVVQNEIKKEESS